jgi:cation-transporting ATPase I
VVALSSLLRIPGGVLGTAQQLTAAAAAISSVPALAAAEVVADSAQAGVRVARTTMTAATSGAAVVVRVASGMVKPPQRQSRRVWSGGGRVHVELAASALQGRLAAHRALLKQLEGLDGVDWATVNEIVGRVLVAFDERRITVGDVVAVVNAVERTQGGRQGLPERREHPGDLEPLLAAVITTLIDSAAIGVALAGRALGVPALTRHATVALSVLDAVPQTRRALTARLGAIGTDLAFAGVSALLHAASQSPVVPALNAVAGAQRVLEMSARRAVWRRREPQLCRPEWGAGNVGWTPPVVQRPSPLRPGPVESYRDRLDPGALVSAAGLLVLTRRPSRAADLMKSLTFRPAVQGREAFAAVFDALMCRRGVVPMDGSAYRRLDRVDVIVLDSDVLCTGPPVVLQAVSTAPGWGTERVWSAASRLLGTDTAAGDGHAEGLRLGPPQQVPDVSGAHVHQLLEGHDVVGTVTVTREPGPLVDAVVAAARSAAHRLVLTDHPGVRGTACAADEVADPVEPLIETVHRLQADGSGVLVVSATDDAGLLAADVGVAPTRLDRPPAWGADLITEPGLGEVWRLLVAVPRARSVSRLVVGTSLGGNLIGALLATFGSPDAGQPAATTPTKAAGAVSMAIGAWSALSVDARPLPATGATGR